MSDDTTVNGTGTATTDDAPAEQPDTVGAALAAMDAELLSESTAPYVSARAAAAISAVIHAIAGR